VGVYLKMPKKLRLRKRICEAMGLDFYSRPSLYDIDRQLEKYLNYGSGFFIEAGANDGYNQSNTYYLESFKKWRGILIEGIPELYQECLEERPQARVFNCALVADDFSDSHVTMYYGNLMSVVKGSRKSEAGDREQIELSKQVQQNFDSYEVRVPARTLTSILDECQVKKIDFFSLDVEGFELNVLKGLDFKKYQPKYMLIEASFPEEIEDYISNLYIKVDRLSHHDILYKLR
jgi:FkbM family methyltransferase